MIFLVLSLVIRNVKLDFYLVCGTLIYIDFPKVCTHL